MERRCCDCAAAVPDAVLVTGLSPVSCEPMICGDVNRGGQYDVKPLLSPKKYRYLLLAKQKKTYSGNGKESQAREQTGAYLV